MKEEQEPINNNENEEHKENKKNLFNMVIGVSTLLIAILGATFAYFSATATSKENDVNVKSAYVSISYDGGTEIKANNLIPASERVALAMFQKEVSSIGYENQEGLEITDQDEYTNDPARKCIDVKGREVCYVYQFTIKSDGEEGNSTAMNGTIKINENEFDNLSYILYEVEFQKDIDGNILVDKYGHRVVESYEVVSDFDKTDDNSDHDERDPKYALFEKPIDNRDDGGNYQSTTYPVACLFGFSESYGEAQKDDITRCKTLEVTNQESHTYQLMIWLRETGNIQPEQGMSFQGTVSLEVAGGNKDYEDGKVTGKQ